VNRVQICLFAVRENILNLLVRIYNLPLFT